MSRWFLLWFGLMSSQTIAAQEIDSARTVILPEVVVQVGLLDKAKIGFSEDALDNATLKQLSGLSLADLFRTSAGAQLRAYGSNGLATPSIRGTGGNHTAVLWNGITLQSPLSGTQDLSLIPNSFLDNVNIQKGGSSSIYGSGAIGGTIQLNNKTVFGEGFGLSIIQQLGSFGSYFHSYKLSYSSSKFSNSTSFFQRKIDNDYPYINIYVKPEVEEIRQNAGLNQIGLLQQNDWLIDPHNQLRFKLWYQDNSTEIPTPTFVNNESEAVQEDEFFRGLLNWYHDKGNLSLEYKLAFIDHSLTYSSTSDTSHNDYSTIVNRLVSTFDFHKRAVLIVAANHSYNNALVSAFGSAPVNQSVAALFASFQTSTINGSLKGALSIRQELVDGKIIPITPSLGLEYNAKPMLLIRSRISRNYRIPTLNELYWQGANAEGNLDLLPEDSFNAELGVDIKLRESKSWKFIGSATVYHSMVNNWIQWQQSTSIWSPVNLKKVWSRGLETKLITNYTSDLLRVDITGAYNFTKTTNKAVIDSANESILNKQLTYTPLHEASFLANIGYWKFSFSFDYSFTAKQYTEEENRDRFALSSYQVVNLSTGYNTKFNKLDIGLIFRINNVFDESYENRRGYPMYRRNFMLELKLNFNNKHTMK